MRVRVVVGAMFAVLLSVLLVGSGSASRADQAPRGIGRSIARPEPPALPATAANAPEVAALPRTYPPESDRVFDRVSAPELVTNPEYVSFAEEVLAPRASATFPAALLPLGFTIQRQLAERFGEQAVVAAVRQWDGIPGSRWATRYDGVVEVGSAEPAADGLSTVYLKADCAPGTAGLTYRQFSNAVRDARYGQAHWSLHEADIAVCAAVADAARMYQIVGHEVGHAFGLDHLCNAGQSCWRDGMGDAPQDCRIMYAGATTCEWRVDRREWVGAAALYPALARVSGPTRIQTAARASFATYPRASATTVVLARGDASAHGPLSAAPLAALRGAPLLLGAPTVLGCVEGATAEELARVAAPRATLLLVGDWPSSCEAQLSGWSLRVQRVGAAAAGDPITLGVAVAAAVADAARGSAVAFLVGATTDAAGHLPDAVAAAAAAGATRSPLLFTGGDRLDPRVVGWLAGAGRQVQRLYLVGGTASISQGVAADAAALGIEVTRVAGPGRVETALALAGRTDVFPAGPRQVVIVSADRWPDAATGSALAARLGAPVLASPITPHAAVAAWLASQQVVGGYVVGGVATITTATQVAYSGFVVAGGGH